MSDSIIKLPLFAKTKALKSMPCHERGRKFLITEAIQPQPENSMGYLVEDMGSRKVKILAWIALGGAVYECDQPLVDRPDHRSDGGMAKDGDNVFFYVRERGQMMKVVHFNQREGDGRFTVTKWTNDMGPYQAGAYDIDEIAFASFLAHWIMPHERGEELSAETVGEILDGMMAAPYPDALDALAYRGARDNATPFDRFAARSLLEAGAEYVRPIAAAHDVDLRRLSSTGLFWTAYNRDELVDREIDTLQAVEGALNRLIFMERYLGTDKSPVAAALTEHAVEHAAILSLSSFASVAETALRGCENDNPYLKVAGAQGKRGGEWDLRTRFAFEVERLRTPFCFSYDFDVDARGGLFRIDANVPAASAFPLAAAEAGRNDARSCYVLRLSLALATIAFGSGVGVTRVVVNIHERLVDGPIIASLGYSRQGLIMEVMPHVKSEAAFDSSLSFGELVRKAGPAELRIEFGDDGSLAPVEPIEFALPDRTMKMAEDGRALPECLRGSLHADAVSDIDIFATDDDPLRERYMELRNRMEEGGADAGLAAEMADIVAAYDAVDAMQEDGRKPLYCVNMVSRILAGADDPEARFRKVPDTAYDARSSLCSIYREQGNLEDALAIAEHLVELAPSSFGSYHSLALVYREQERLDDAIRVLHDALSVASIPLDIAVAYYRLGFYYWQSGEPSIGLACYAMVRRGSYFYEVAQQEMEDLMRQEHLNAPSYSEARSILRTEGVPLAPVSGLVESTAQAALDLVDAGFFDAAQGLIHFLGSCDVGPNCNDVLPSVANSLR